MSHIYHICEQILEQFVKMNDDWLELQSIQLVQRLQERSTAKKMVPPLWSDRYIYITPMIVLFNKDSSWNKKAPSTSRILSWILQCHTLLNCQVVFESCCKHGPYWWHKTASRRESSIALLFKNIKDPISKPSLSAKIKEKPKLYMGW